MKYIVILGDGMADEPIDALGGKTPLACAETPVMDELASKGEMGMVQNVPAGMAPGSDVANLSVLGYDPAVCYSGTISSGSTERRRRHGADGHRSALQHRNADRGRTLRQKDHS